MSFFPEDRKILREKVDALKKIIKNQKEKGKLGESMTEQVEFVKIPPKGREAVQKSVKSAPEMKRAET